MRLSSSVSAAVVGVVFVFTLCAQAQAPPRLVPRVIPVPTATRPPTPTPVPTVAPTPTVTPPQPTSTPLPTYVEGYAGELQIETTLSGVKDAPASPEAQGLLGRMRDRAHVRTRLLLAQDMSRLEIVSPDFLLPAGTVLLHEAGSKFYVIADPKAQTYVIVDAEGILRALEGGIGIENSEYAAKVQHTTEKKVIGGVSCRRSTVSVTYVSSVPLESDRVLVQQTNDIQVWHTPDLVSRALLDHFFFKFQRDKTGTVQKLVSTELGFPMDLSMSVLEGTGKRATTPAGSLRVTVLEIHAEKKLDAEWFRLPPAGFKKLDRNPYFAGAAARP